MSWIHKSPFASHEEAVGHILDLLAAEAERAGTPLSESERNFLSDQCDFTFPEEFTIKTKRLIEMVLDHEPDVDDPKSLGNSLAWAGSEFGCPNVTMLAEQVIISRGERLPKLRGQRWVGDRIQLVGCAIVTMILIMIIGLALGWLIDQR